MEKEVGVVDHFFGHIMVVGIRVTADSIKVGDTLHIKGHTTDCKFTVESMQVDNESVSEAKKGDSIGIKVDDRCREHDKVFKVD